MRFGTKQGFNGLGRWRLIALFFVMLALPVFAARPAYAQYTCPLCISTDIAGFAKDAASWAIDHAEQLVEFAWRQLDSARTKAQQTVLAVARTLSDVLGASLADQRQKDALGATSDIARAQIASQIRGQTMGRAPSNHGACVVIKFNQLAVQGESFFDTAQSLIKNLLYTRCPTGSGCDTPEEVGVEKGLVKNVGFNCAPSSTSSSTQDPDDKGLLCGADTFNFSEARIMEMPSTGSGQISISSDLHQKLWLGGLSKAFKIAGTRPPAPAATDNSNYANEYRNCLAAESGDLEVVAKRMARFTRPNCSDTANKAVCDAQQKLCNIALNNRGIPAGESLVKDCTKGLTLFQIQYLVHKACITDQAAIDEAGGNGGDDRAEDRNNTCFADLENWKRENEDDLEKFNTAVVHLANIHDTCWARLKPQQSSGTVTK